MKREQLYYLMSFLGVLTIMGMGRYFSSEGMGWYNTLRLPDIIPSGWVYVAVWTFLYACIAIVAAWLLKNAIYNAYWLVSMGMFMINIVANASWSYIFFYKKLIFAGFVDCIIVLVTAFILMLLVSKKSKSMGLLLLPYVAWMLLASYQNYLVWQLNSWYGS